MINLKFVCMLISKSKKKDLPYNVISTINIDTQNLPQQHDIKQYFIDMQSLLINKNIYPVFKQYNLHYFIPFLSFSMMLQIYDQIQNNNDIGTHLHYSINLEQIILNYIVDILVHYNIKDEIRMRDALLYTIQTLNSHIYDNNYNQYIPQIISMFEYLNTLIPHEEYETIRILDIPVNCIINDNVKEILDNFTSIYIKQFANLLDKPLYLVNIYNEYKDINMQVYLPFNLDMINKNNEIYKICTHKNIYCKAETSNNNADMKYFNYQSPYNNRFFIDDVISQEEKISNNYTSIFKNYVNKLPLAFLNMYKQGQAIYKSMNIIDRSIEDNDILKFDTELFKLYNNLEKKHLTQSLSVFITLIININL